jgi:2-amino-4-hydroxy-6-hydroxymethyldihydropteridine diphosphokinase
MAQEFLIALGSNLHMDTRDSLATVQSAIAALNGSIGRVLRVSRFFQTPAFPAGNGPDYINACVSIQSDLTPEQVLGELHKIEANHGRTREKRWASRTLDLDLIAAGDMIQPDPATFNRWLNLPLGQQTQIAPDMLILPHPRLHERGFVLVPLADIASHWIHPVLRQNVAHLRDSLSKPDVAEIVPV